MLDRRLSAILNACFTDPERSERTSEIGQTYASRINHQASARMPASEKQSSIFAPAAKGRIPPTADEGLTGRNVSKGREIAIFN